MLVARTDLGRLMERTDEEEPLVDVLLALSAATAAMIAALDLVAGRLPVTALPCLAILALHLLRLRRMAIVVAAVVWLRVLGLSDASGFVTPLAMLLICLALFIGPGRVLDWFEARWEASHERRWLESRPRLAVQADARAIEAIGWIEDLQIEDLSDPR